MWSKTRASLVSLLVRFYINDIIEDVRNSGFGIYIGSVFGEFQAKNLASSSNEVNELQELFRK